MNISTDEKDNEENSKSFEKAKQLFKQRYKKLEKIYEERLSSLLTQIKCTYRDIQSDDAVTEMSRNGNTIQYAASRIKEIVDNSLELEREKIIQHLAEQLSEKDVKYSELLKEITFLMKRLQDKEKVEVESKLVLTEAKKHFAAFDYQKKQFEEKNNSLLKINQDSKEQINQLKSSFKLIEKKLEEEEVIKLKLIKESEIYKEAIQECYKKLEEERNKTKAEIKLGNEYKQQNIQLKLEFDHLNIEKTRLVNENIVSNQKYQTLGQELDLLLKEEEKERKEAIQYIKAKKQRLELLLKEEKKENEKQRKLLQEENLKLERTNNLLQDKISSLIEKSNEIENLKQLQKRSCEKINELEKELMIERESRYKGEKEKAQEQDNKECILQIMKQKYELEISQASDDYEKVLKQQKQEINDLKEIIKEKENTKAKILNSKDLITLQEHRERITELHLENEKKLLEEKAFMKARIKQQEIDVNEKESLYERLENANENITRLTKILEEHKKKNFQLQNILENNRKGLRQRDNNIRNKQKAIHGWKKQLVSYKENLIYLKEIVQDLTNEMWKSFKETIQTMETLYEKKYKKLKEENEYLHKSFEKEEEKTQELIERNQEKLEEKEKEIKEKTNELLTCKQKLDNTLKLAYSWKNKNNDKEEENSRNQVQLLSLKEEINSLNLTINSKTKELEMEKVEREREREENKNKWKIKKEEMKKLEEIKLQDRKTREIEKQEQEKLIILQNRKLQMFQVQVYHIKDEINMLNSEFIKEFDSLHKWLKRCLKKDLIMKAKEIQETKESLYKKKLLQEQRKANNLESEFTKKEEKYLQFLAEKEVLIKKNNEEHHRSQTLSIIQVKKEYEEKLDKKENFINQLENELKEYSHELKKKEEKLENEFKLNLKKKEEEIRKQEHHISQNNLTTNTLRKTIENLENKLAKGKISSQILECRIGVLEDKILYLKKQESISTQVIKFRKQSEKRENDDKRIKFIQEKEQEIEEIRETYKKKIEELKIKHKEDKSQIQNNHDKIVANLEKSLKELRENNSIMMNSSFTSLLGISKGK